MRDRIVALLIGAVMWAIIIAIALFTAVCITTPLIYLIG